MLMRLLWPCLHGFQPKEKLVEFGERFVIGIVAQVGMVSEGFDPQANRLQCR
jgi:hypothetical protein